MVLVTSIFRANWGISDVVVSFPHGESKEYGDFRVITSHGFSKSRIKLMWLNALECKHQACHQVIHVVCRVFGQIWPVAVAPHEFVAGEQSFIVDLYI